MSETTAYEAPNKILILKSNPLALQSAERFLKSRAWTVFSCVNLAEAIQLILESKVDYFIVCANHQQKKVRAIPKLLAQISNVKIISYIDIANTVNMAILQEMNVAYQLLPPVSGPSIERIIIKYEKDLLQKKDETTGSPNEMFNSIKAPAGKKRAEEKLNYFLNNDDESEAPPDLNAIDSADSPENKPDEKASQPESFSEYDERMRKMGPGGVKDPHLKKTLEEDGEGQLGSFTPKGKPRSADASSLTYDKKTPAAGAAEIDYGSETPTAKAGDLDYGKKTPTAGAAEIDYGGSSKKIGSDANEVSSETKLSGSQDTRPPEKAFGFITDIAAKTTLQRGVDHAVDTSVERGGEPPHITNKLTKVQNCVCLSIRAEKFSGFLVAAMGQNRHFDDQLIAAIQTRLYDFVVKQGIKINKDEPMEITIRPVQFETWAVEKAEFLKKSIHNGNEVAMAFFPEQQTAPALEKSESADMVSLAIDDVTTDTPLHFDIYIHLKANNKYILYTPKGGVFLTDQKSRLKAKGVTKLHMKKEALPEIKKHHVETKLNNSIQEFEAKIESEQKKKA